MATYNVYSVDVKVRLQSATDDNPSLLASASGSTAVLDSITINGVETDLRAIGSAEKTTIAAAVKQAVVDRLDFTVGSVTAGSNTGNGTVSTPTVTAIRAALETWTLTAISATVFRVSGSVSGPQANASTGVAYNNGIVAFTITAGGTPFVANDSFTFAITG